MPSFNLVDQPWLPCVTHGGAGRTVSLRETLQQAHDLRELYDPSPLVTVSLHRLLLAILHRAYQGPEGIEEWSEIWRSGRFDAARVNAYLDQWRHRFDLFDPDRPFYQVPFIDDLADPKKQAPIAKLAQEAAAGNNATLFDHSVDDEPIPISAAVAARYVVAVQAFSIGFGKSFPFYLSDSTLIRGFSVLASGGNLFETLALNLMRYTEESPIPWSRQGDTACWERPTLPSPIKEGTPLAGYCDLLTWQSRQIHLVSDAGGETVSLCQFRQNLKLASASLDPFKCYLRDEQRGLRVRSFRPQRALWRDSTMLFQQLDPQENAMTMRPELMNWLAEIEQAGDSMDVSLQPVYRLHAYGLTTDDGNAASVVLWRREELPLPLALLALPDAVTALGKALAAAETVGRVLGQTARDLASFLLAPASDEREARKSDPEDVKRLARDLAIEQRFWPRLDEPFARLLTGLPEDQQPHPDDPDDVEYGANELPRWRDAVRKAAEKAFTEATASLDRSARSLKAVAVVRGRFEGKLAKALQLQMNEVDVEEQGGEAA